MKFAKQIRVTNGVAGPDPIANPEDAVGPAVVELRSRRPDADVPYGGIAFALDGPAGETVTLDLFLLNEKTEPGPDAEWHRFQTAVVVTARELQQVTAPDGVGKVFVRVTGDTLTAARSLYVQPII